jgi:hypothetical protein
MPPLNEKILIEWTEPLFFKTRTVTKTGWIIRGLVFLLIYASSFFDDDPFLINDMGITLKFLLPAIIAGLFLLIIEHSHSQRIIFLSKNLFCFGTTNIFVGSLCATTNWNKREIKEVQLFRPNKEENTFPFGIMVVTRKYAKAKKFGVPVTVNFDEIADHFHSMEIDVKLTDWEPLEKEAETTSI